MQSFCSQQPEPAAAPALAVTALASEAPALAVTALTLEAPALAVTPPTPPAPPARESNSDDDSTDDLDDTPKKRSLYKMKKTELDAQFIEIDRIFSSLAITTTLEETYLRKKYIKQSDPRVVFAGDNSWNDFRGAFTSTDFREEELARSGLTDDYAKAQSEPDKRAYN